MLIEISALPLNEYVFIKEFIVLFLLLYIVLFPIFIRLLVNAKASNYSFIDSVYQLFRLEDNNGFDIKSLLLHFGVFSFVWILYVFSLFYFDDFVSLFASVEGDFLKFLVIWMLGVSFIFVKTILILLFGFIFAMPRDAYLFSLMDMKGWIAFSILLFPVVALQLNDSLSIPFYVEIILMAIPLIVIFGKKILFLFSVKDYSWFIKLLYICSLEILLLFICIILIFSFI